VGLTARVSFSHMCLVLFVLRSLGIVRPGCGTAKFFSRVLGQELRKAMTTVTIDATGSKVEEAEENTCPEALVTVETPGKIHTLTFV